MLRFLERWATIVEVREFEINTIKMLQQLRSLQFKPWEITRKGSIVSGAYIKILALIKLSGVEKGRAMARMLLFTRTSRSLIAQRLG